MSEPVDRKTIQDALIYGHPPLYTHPAPAAASLRDMTEADFDKAHGIAPAGVPDVAGLTHKLLYWARSSAENRPQAADAMREAADALAALQSQVLDLKGSLDTSRLCTHERDRKVAQQAERITELKAKLAEAATLIDHLGGSSKFIREVMG